MNQLVLAPAVLPMHVVAAMAPITARTDRFAPRAGRPPAGALQMPQARSNTVTASHARAAQRREARRDQRAVAAWLRALCGRGRGAVPGARLLAPPGGRARSLTGAVRRRPLLDSRPGD